jgi:hypothetical protein
MRIPRFIDTAPPNCSSFLLAMSQAHDWVAASARASHQLAVSLLPALFLLESSNRDEVYNILWGLVFGFATLNILSLGARRFEQKSGLNFGEVLAILVVFVSIVLLGWEMLYVFHVLPIRLTPR